MIINFCVVEHRGHGSWSEFLIGYSIMFMHCSNISMFLGVDQKSSWEEGVCVEDFAKKILPDQEITLVHS